MFHTQMHGHDECVWGRKCERIDRLIFFWCMMCVAVSLRRQSECCVMTTAKISLWCEGTEKKHRQKQHRRRCCRRRRRGHIRHHNQWRFIFIIYSNEIALLRTNGPTLI